jgi:hypothetical protein
VYWYRLLALLTLPVFALLFVALGAAVAVITRKLWASAIATAILFMLTLPPREWRSAILPIVFIALGVVGGAMGLAIKRRSGRLAALYGAWALTGTELLHLFSLTESTHSYTDIVFDVALIAATLVLSITTIFSLPPEPSTVMAIPNRPKEHDVT